ncbi:MAG: Hint domain-containing protein [Roseomonas sp.]|nr:Hint domain-containing protein [Roseomonas sp.]
MSSSIKGIAADARVMTSRGDRFADRLGPGMMLLAVTPGIAPFQRVLGIRHIPYRGPLIRVLAGVLGTMAPREDLLMLPDQGVVFQGLAYRAGDLVDGIAIRQEEAPPDFTAIDILLEGHAGILVQGATLEMGLAQPATPGPLRRVPLDGDITAHIVLMGAEITLEEEASKEVPSTAPLAVMAPRPAAGSAPLAKLPISKKQTKRRKTNDAP